jgi:hypothetical protein
MSKTVFDHLTESIDQVVKGRRFLIAEIGKVKTDVGELRELVEKSSGGSDMGAMINDLKSFTQRTLQTLSELKSSVTQLGGLVKNLTQAVQSLQMRGGGAPQQGYAPQPQAQPAYAPQQGYAPQPQAQPAYAPQQGYAPQPQAQPAYAPQPQAAAPAAAANPAAVAAAFDKLIQLAGSGTPAKDIGTALDNLRGSLAKANPLNPILFELSMEAGRLKSLGGAPLDGSNLDGLKQKVAKWKSKS